MSDLGELAANLQSSRRLNAAIRANPKLGHLVRLINPAGDLSNPLKRHVIAHAALQEGRIAAFRAAYNAVAIKPFRKLFEGLIDDDGWMTLQARTGRSVRVHFTDFMEDPNVFVKYDLTPDQFEGWQYRHDLWNNLKDDYEKVGGRPLDPLEEEDFAKFPRMVKGRIDPSDGKLKTKDAGTRGPASFGISPTSARARAQKPIKDTAGNVIGYVEKTGAEMVNNGWRYFDPDDALLAKGQELSRRIADQQLVQYLKSQPYIRTKAQILGKGAKTGVYPQQPASRFGLGSDDEIISVRAFSSHKVPALQGYFAPKEIADYVEEVLSRPEKVELPVISQLSQSIRGLVASYDFGTLGIQLMGSVATDLGHLVRAGARLAKGDIRGARRSVSFVTGRAVEGLFRAFADPTFLLRYYEKNKDFIDEWADYMGGLRNTELLSAVARGEDILSRTPGLGNIQRRFAISFEASLDIAKIEQLKAYSRIFPNMSPAEREAIGSWVRNSIGVLSTQRLGVSPRQQDIEATFLFFSPRYTRSLFAAVGAILKNDIGGTEARLAIGSLITAGVLTYIAVANALGQKPQLNPTKPGFLSVRVGDNYVGIGGGVRAMSRLIAGSFESARNNPKAFISPDFHGEDSNPLLRFWRSRSAPVTNTALDIFTGTDFLGREVDLGDETSWVRLLEDRVLPFSLQAALEARGGFGTKVGLALASGLGFNPNPMTAYQIYDSYLRNVRRADGEQRFPDGAATVNTDENRLRDFLKHDPIARRLKEQYEEARRDGEAGADSQRIQRVIDDRRHRLEMAETRFKETGDYVQYRFDVNAIRAYSRDAMEDLALSTTSRTSDRKVVSSWYALYDDPRAIDPVTGGIDSAGLEAIQEEWKRKHPGEYERLIEPNESLGETELESQLRRDRKVISDSGWWDTDEVAFEDIVRMADRNGFKMASTESYQDYRLKRYEQLVNQARRRGLRQPELVASIYLERDPVVKLFVKMRTYHRMLLQRQNPELVVLLNRWGYNRVSEEEYALAARL